MTIASLSIMPPIVERPRMASYDVPEDLDGVLPWSWAEERLMNSRNYWVTTVDPAGRPHSMPVWGVWLSGEERFWFSCAPDALKARNAKANPHVVIAPTDTVEVVSLEGVAEDTSNRDLSTRVDSFYSKYGAEMGISEEEARGFLTSHASFDVIPDRAFGMIERPDDFAKRATRWRWVRQA